MIRHCVVGTMVFMAVAASPQDVEYDLSWLPTRCESLQTAGLHDFPGGEEVYEPTVFEGQAFSLDNNPFVATHLADVDVAVTLSSGAETTEFACRHVRGANDARGFSCINSPPSQILLLNPDTLRFTRAAIGGWTFYNATIESGGDSLFIEYGVCGGAAD